MRQCQELKDALSRVAAEEHRSESELILEAIRALVSARKGRRLRLPLTERALGDPNIAERADDENSRSVIAWNPPDYGEAAKARMGGLVGVGAQLTDHLFESMERREFTEVELRRMVERRQLDFAQTGMLTPAG